MKRFLVVIAMLMIVSGCAPWQPVAGLYTADSDNFVVDLPKGWMRQNTGEYLLITREGVLLQKIVISRLSLDKEEQFEHTKQRLSKGMLPQEQAEVIIDSIQSDPSALNFEVEENAPATAGGGAGFRLVYEFKTKDGLKYRGTYYGFIAGEWAYRILYVAPQRYYFDKDKGTFEGILKSFRLIKTG